MGTKVIESKRVRVPRCIGEAQAEEAEERLEKADLVEMKGHVFHLNYDVARQSRGTKPEQEQGRKKKEMRLVTESIHQF